MAMAVTGYEAGGRRAPVLWLVATAGLGPRLHCASRAPNIGSSIRSISSPRSTSIFARHGGVAEIFFMFYFCATGLHALHLLIGIGS